MKIQLNAAPRGHFIESIRARDMVWREALCEFIDNSLDAGASEISVAFEKDETVIKDNGCGCDDLDAMLALGAHVGDESDRSGRYGVGLKNAAISMAENISIATTRNGIRRRVKLNWDKFYKAGWKGEADEDPSPSIKNGTTIGLSGLRRRHPLRSVCEELSYTFTPAIRRGVQVYVYDSLLEPEPEPIFERKLEYQVWIGDVGFRSVGGILPHGSINKRKPFVIAYKHRMVDESSEPLGELLTSERFYCYVELLERTKDLWLIREHKDGLIRSDNTEWLYETLAVQYGEILEQLHNEGEHVELDGIAATSLRTSRL